MRLLLLLLVVLAGCDSGGSAGVDAGGVDGGADVGPVDAANPADPCRGGLRCGQLHKYWDRQKFDLCTEGDCGRLYPPASKSNPTYVACVTGVATIWRSCEDLGGVVVADAGCQLANQCPLYDGRLRWWRQGCSCEVELIPCDCGPPTPADGGTGD